MSCYVVTGKLGAGKNLAAVGRIRDYLERGRPVATNIDLDLVKLVPGVERPMVIRVPDFPGPDDLNALGSVANEDDETLNGAVVLDECGVLLNAREWGDKSRQAVIDWMLHSRKLGWDVYLIVQNLTLLDKQLRDALAEFLVVVRRTDRLMIPGLGRVLRFVSGRRLSGNLPRIHVATVQYGVGQGASHADTWTFRGIDLFGCYRTKQRFSRSYEHGLHCLLPNPAPFRATGIVQAEAGGVAARSVAAPAGKLPAVAALLSLPPDARIAAWWDLHRSGAV